MKIVYSQQLTVRDYQGGLDFRMLVIDR